MQINSKEWISQLILSKLFHNILAKQIVVDCLQWNFLPGLATSTTKQYFFFYPSWQERFWRKANCMAQQQPFSHTHAHTHTRTHTNTRTQTHKHVQTKNSNSFYFLPLPPSVPPLSISTYLRRHRLRAKMDRRSTISCLLRLSLLNKTRARVCARV